MTSIQEVREELLRLSKEQDEIATAACHTGENSMRLISEGLIGGYDHAASLVAKLEDEQAKRIEELESRSKVLDILLSQLESTAQSIPNKCASDWVQERDANWAEMARQFCGFANDLIEAHVR